MQLDANYYNRYKRVFVVICNSFTCGRVPFLLFSHLFPFFHFISRTVNSFRIKSRGSYRPRARASIRFLSYPYRSLFPRAASRYILSTASVLTMILNNTRRPSPHLLNVRRIPLVLSVAGNIASLFPRVCLRTRATSRTVEEINILNSSKIIKALFKAFHGFADRFHLYFLSAEIIIQRRYN